MNNTLIIGGGFMGHSLALALKAANKDSAISVVEVIQEYRVLLEKSNIYDVVYNKIDQVNSKFHQVIICTTPETTSQILDLILKLFCHSDLITDISSSKSFLNGKKLPANFVSSHPVCGSEKKGPIESRADLFNQQPCILIRNDMQSLETCSSFWKSLGMKIFQMDSQIHDKTFSDISHLPHVIGRAFYLYIQEKEIPEDILGTSAKELLRLGKANKNLWDEIFKDNSRNLKGSIGGFQSYIEKIKKTFDI